MKKALILLLIICTTNLSSAENILLQAPLKISEKIVDKCITQSTSNNRMKWISCFNSNFGSKSCLKFSIAFGANHNSSFQLSLTGNKFINELTENEISLFKRKENTLVYSYGDIINDASKKQKKTKFPIFAQPLIIPQATPVKLSVSEVAKFISDKNVIFYTGAGISSPVVPDMTELMKQFKMLYNPNGDIDKFTHIIEFVRRTLKESDNVIKTIDSFKESCLYSNPTPAHHAVKEIVLLKNWQLLTENLDLLHQRSGVEPLGRVSRTDKMDFYWLKKNIKSKYLKQIDFIVAIGLHSDEVGFLALYKKHNPKGKIIAMNLIQPEYLGNDDILVLGDVQKFCQHLQLLTCLQ
ncbi:SIR2 family protein [Wolbachia endosymbiont of Folsomia candida]|uniref:hypothetical protein n=1 Tax=Wolbachia endosymbiont of Folsomia candida TaxID=169402 RepID=UPI000ABF535B|nr:hypothetical protein [Wolbachia endosymbiont of Folsomia candida]APR98465.1 hypothetical protein ASM33_04310 [Wolbachia endosymbiont of Folsomia candida]